MHVVRKSCITGWRDLVYDLGFEPECVSERLDNPALWSNDEDAFVSYEQVIVLLEQCRDVCAEPLFGLLLARRQQLSGLGELPAFTPRAASIRGAFEAVARMIYLHTSATELYLQPLANQARTVIVINSHARYPVRQTQKALLSVGHALSFITWLRDGQTTPATILLKQTASALPKELSLPSSQAIAFGREYDGLEIDNSLLNQPVIVDRVTQGTLLRRYLRRLSDEFPGQTAPQVQEIVESLLPSGECSVERVAQILGTSRRSLQSHLASEGTSYRDILNGIRQGIAERELLTGQLSMTELAFQLGYSELAVFSRHFKQWTGLSPAAWRRANLTVAAA